MALPFDLAQTATILYVEQSGDTQEQLLQFSSRQSKRKYTAHYVRYKDLECACGARSVEPKCRFIYIIATSFHFRYLEGFVETMDRIIT